MSVERPILAIFPTTQTQTAMANLLKDYPQTYVTNMVYP